MKKIANQILYNLKKEKTSFISFGVIILITALILNCAAVLPVSYTHLFRVILDIGDKVGAVYPL